MEVPCNILDLKKPSFNSFGMDYEEEAASYNSTVKDETLGGLNLKTALKENSSRSKSSSSSSSSSKT
jgi:hypothetical protein